MAEIQNITCAAFDAMPETEQLAFVIGVCNGRAMTAGVFDAYAGAAQAKAKSPAERESIAAIYRAIAGPMAPLLSIDAGSLLHGIRATCRQPELRDSFVIEALASVHLAASRAMRESGKAE